MKKLLNVVETEQSGMEELLGEEIIIFSVNYIYTGKLVGVNDTCVLLDNAKLVYETGNMSEPGFKDAQDLPCSQWYVSTSAIESFGRIRQ